MRAMREYDDAKIIGLLAAGHTISEIAKRTGISYQRLYLYCRRQNLLPPQVPTLADFRTRTGKTALLSTSGLLNELYLASSPGCDCPTCVSIRAVQAARHGRQKTPIAELLLALVPHANPVCDCPACVSIREIHRRLLLRGIA